jgi:hypothetical protein
MRQWGQEHLDVYGENEPAQSAPRADAAGPLPEGSVREPSFRRNQAEPARPMPDIALVS